MAGTSRPIGSDLKRVDAYVLGPADYAEVPEVDFDPADADLVVAGKVVRRGRPKSAHPKQAVNLRLSPRVLSRFRAGGPGWQTRINAALEQWLDEHPNKT